MNNMAHHWQLTLGDYTAQIERAKAMTTKERMAFLTAVEYEPEYEVEVLRADVEITSCDPNEGLTGQEQ